jgi:hypothetical protein
MRCMVAIGAVEADVLETTLCRWTWPRDDLDRKTVDNETEIQVVHE